MTGSFPVPFFFFSRLSTGPPVAPPPLVDSFYEIVLFQARQVHFLRPPRPDLGDGDRISTVSDVHLFLSSIRSRVLTPDPCPPLTEASCVCVFFFSVSSATDSPRPCPRQSYDEAPSQRDLFIFLGSHYPSQASSIPLLVHGEGESGVFFLLPPPGWFVELQRSLADLFHPRPRRSSVSDP